MRRGWRYLDPEIVTAVVLGLVAAGVVAAVALDPERVPFTALNVPLLIGAVLLSPRTLTWFVGFITVMIGVVALAQSEWTVRTLAAIVILALLCVTVFVLSLRRSGATTSGVGGRQSASMLVDLRDRILAQGQIPELPDRWLVESSLSSAGGSPFAGDFVVATTREHGRRLEMALVDVSGKGEAAGTRALQLSGAMGGLLGALPPAQFLSAANDYLIARRWAEGFATAVHLSLDLLTGDFEIRAAGHPPPVQRHAGSGRWELLPTEGMILGLVEGVEYDGVRGRLARGDALLLYTDGMVEEPRKDIELGIDAMLGTTESMLRGSWDGMARRLTAAVGSRDDDRALMLVHRR